MDVVPVRRNTLVPFTVDAVRLSLKTAVIFVPVATPVALLVGVVEATVGGIKSAAITVTFIALAAGAVPATSVFPVLSIPLDLITYDPADEGVQL